MKILIVLAHPDTKSFNHAIADRVRKILERSGHNVVFCDLYRDRFDPILPSKEIEDEMKRPAKVQSYARKVSGSDGIIIVHPNWWGQPPAILKGWVDRVLREGVGYRFVEGDDGEGVPEGLLKAKVAIVFNTSNTFEEREKKIFGDPLHRIWENCIFGLCGVRNFYRRTFSPVVTSSLAQRRKWLDEVSRIIHRSFPKK